MLGLRFVPRFFFLSSFFRGGGGGVSISWPEAGPIDHGSLWGIPGALHRSLPGGQGLRHHLRALGACAVRGEVVGSPGSHLPILQQAHRAGDRTSENHEKGPLLLDPLSRFLDLESLSGQDLDLKASGHGSQTLPCI